MKPAIFAFLVLTLFTIATPASAWHKDPLDRRIQVCERLCAHCNVTCGSGPKLRELSGGYGYSSGPRGYSGGRGDGGFGWAPQKRGQDVRIHRPDGTSIEID